MSPVSPAPKPPVRLMLAAAGVSLGLATPAHAVDFAQYVSYTQGDVPSYLQSYNDASAIGTPPQGTTGAEFGFPGVVSPFNPPFDTDQIALVGIGGQLTVQFPHTLTVGSAPEIGVFSNVGLIDNDYPNATATAPVSTFGGGSALFSVSQDGTHWFDLGIANINNPENFYLNAGPYDIIPPASPQLADFSQPFTGSPNSLSGQTYPQIVSTLNGSAGGTWLNLFGSGLSQVNYLRISEPQSQPAGAYLAIEAISVANTLSAPATFSAASGSWANPANWTNGIIPQNPQDAAQFPTATASAIITLDGNQTAGHLVFPAGSSYTIAPGSGGALTLDNGSLPATIQITGAHSITSPLLSAGPVNIVGSGTLTLGANATLAGPLTIQTPAAVDLATYSLTINYASPDNEQSVVQSAVALLTTSYSAPTGRWSGPGLTSSAAAANPGVFSLAYADGNADPNTSAQPNQLLVKYTFAGDADLDGSVGFSDLVALAQNFGLTAMDWAHGNFMYDPAGSVGFADLVLLAQNFGDQMPAAAADSPAWRLHLQSVSVVPEPISASLLLLAPLALTRRRRTR